ncbi:MAG: A/G-specific adenine glycosylase [Flavobacterium sp.]|nr:MAG: A/G-specific adenine glycosylase [Flavobacterium sp.]
MIKSPSEISKKLIPWYLEHKRDLPWRTTKLPYNIWLSEIMLQQTRVAQGIPYYNAFITEFPTIFDLANASEEKILKLWQGLGYYSRARNLHATAIYISEELNGVFPSTHKELLQLKGVGDYTASAISSISFNLPIAVVDGNVYRVLSRYFGIATPINSTAGIKEFKKLAQQLIDSEKPGIYNQAIMEFGATQCKPQNPACGFCVFNDRCVALQKKNISELPVKLKKTKIKKIYFNYFVILSKKNKTILQQRTGKGIWQNLYEFPLIETDEDVTIEALQELETFKTFIDQFSFSSTVLYNDKAIIHKLSHRHIHTRFWISETNLESKNAISITEINTFPVPILIANFINQFFGDKFQHKNKKNSYI